MPSGFELDPHSQDGHACPRNFFGITDYAKLQPIERTFAMERAAQLLTRGLPGHFDLKHFRSVHRYLFQDVFPWAGELRMVKLSKNGTMFGVPQYIEGNLVATFAKLKGERWLQKLPADSFAERAGYYLGEINSIHPFREGNGRNQREFIRQLASQAGHPLSWGGFTQERIIAASVLSHNQGDTSQLAGMIFEALLSTRAGTTGL